MSLQPRESLAARQLLYACLVIALGGLPCPAGGPSLDSLPRSKLRA